MFDFQQLLKIAEQTAQKGDWVVTINRQVTQVTLLRSQMRFGELVFAFPDGQHLTADSILAGLAAGPLWCGDWRVYPAWEDYDSWRVQTLEARYQSLYLAHEMVLPTSLSFWATVTITSVTAVSGDVEAQRPFQLFGDRLRAYHALGYTGLLVGEIDQYNFPEEMNRADLSYFFALGQLVNSFFYMTVGSQWQDDAENAMVKSTQHLTALQHRLRRQYGSKM